MLNRHFFTLKPAGQANSNVMLAAAGDFIRYRSGVTSSGSTELVVRIDTAGYVTMTPGESLKVPTEFRKVEVISQNGGADVTAELVIGFGESVGAGNVVVSNALTVQDNTAARTKAGYSFLASVPLASSGDAVQLHNPAGSAFNLFVRRVNVAGTPATQAWARQGANGAAGTIAGGAVVNKRVDQATPGGLQLLTATAQSQPTANASNVKLPIGTPPGDVINNTLEPLMLPPGWGLWVCLFTSAAGGTTTFDGWAEPV